MAQWVVEVREAAGSKLLGYFRERKADAGQPGGVFASYMLALADTVAEAHHFPTDHSAEFQVMSLSQEFPNRLFHKTEASGS